MRGRKPKPTQLKVVAGNPGKRPLNGAEPTPPRDAQMPDYLSERAAEHWPVISAQLDAAKLLTSVDVHALALYCEAFARWSEASEAVRREGMVTLTEKGFPLQSPYVAIANKAHDQMVKLLVEFGMTPSSRSRVTKVDDDPDSEFRQFVKAPRKVVG